MLQNSKLTTKAKRASVAAPRSGGSTTAAAAATASTSAVSKSVLESIADVFSERRIGAPSPAIAVKPRDVVMDTTSAEFLAAEERDYVVQTLRAAPLSAFREPSTGSGTVLAPRVADAFESNVGKCTSKSDKTTQNTTGTSYTSNDAFSAASLSSSAALATVTKTLSVLHAILQRCPAALRRRSGNYSRLLRLLAEHHFAAHVADEMKKLWKFLDYERRSAAATKTTAVEGIAAAAAAPDAVALQAFTILSLYSDVLTLWACHVDVAAAPGALDVLGDKSAIFQDASAKASAVSADTLHSLYELNQTMGDALTRLPAQYTPATLRRSVASLTSFLTFYAAQLSDETLQRALANLEGTVENATATAAIARANMAHMAFIAALPTACSRMSPEWQGRALEVVRHATLYDADVAVAYATEGPTSVLFFLVMSAFGAAIRDLLQMMSEAAWSCCTTDALVHLCHAVGLYGASWSLFPSTSYANLIDFLHRALQRTQSGLKAEVSTTLHLPAAHGENSFADARLTALPATARDSPSAIVQANRAAADARRSIDSLVSGAVLGTASDARDLKSEEEFGSEPPANVHGEDAETYLAMCETALDSPRDFLYYLSLFAYVTSALPSFHTSIEELAQQFLLYNDATASPLVVEQNLDAAFAPTSVTRISSSSSANHQRQTSCSDSATTQLFALCVDLLQTNLASTLAAAPLKKRGMEQRQQQQKRRLCESTALLLARVMCAHARSIRDLERATGARNLVRVVGGVVSTIVQSPYASFEMRRVAYTLLRRYASAVEALEDVMTHLLHPSRLVGLGTPCAYAQANFCTAVELHTYLFLHHDEVSSYAMSRLLAVVADVPAGSFRCAANGAAVAAAVLKAVEALHAAKVHDAILFSGVTSAQLPSLLSRLGEVVGTLIQTQKDGDWLSGGGGGEAQGTWQAAVVAVRWLYRSTLLFRGQLPLATAAFPAPLSRGYMAGGAMASVAAAESGRRACTVLEVCLCILCDATYAEVHKEIAEISVAALQAASVQHASSDVLQVFRSNISGTELRHLRETLLVSQKAQMGSASNTLRLEVWQAMLQWCPGLYMLLFGPERHDCDSDSDTEEAASSVTARKESNGESSSDLDSIAAVSADAQPADLPFVKILVVTIHATEASLPEKAVALQLLRKTGLHSVVDVKDVMGLLQKASVVRSERSVALPTVSPSAVAAAQPKHASQTAVAEWEVVTLAVACTDYLNANIAAQLARAKKTDAATNGGDAANSSSSSNSAGGGGIATVNGKMGASVNSSSEGRTPQQRPHLAPLSPPITAGVSPLQAARSKALAKYVDTMDQLLRHAPGILERCCRVYERESRDLHYEDGANWQRMVEAVCADGQDGLRTSVVLPRSFVALGGVGESKSLSNQVSRVTHSELAALHSSANGEAGSLTRRLTPSALETAAARARSSISCLVPTNAFSVLTSSLTATESAELLAQQCLAQVGQPDKRFFHDTADDLHHNLVASFSTAMADFATALEQLVWMSGADTNTAGLFSKRTQSMIESALHAALASRPSARLLAPYTTRHVQQQLKLASAAASILESSVGADLMDLEVSPSVQQTLVRLVGFMKANRHSTFLFADVIAIVAAVPLTTVSELTAAEELLQVLQITLFDQLRGLPGAEDPAAYEVADTLVDGCGRLVSRARADGRVGVVLMSRLLPTLLDYALLVSQHIQPTQPSQASAHRFAKVLSCICDVLVQCGGQAAVLGSLSQDALLGFTQALGQFAVSSVYDPTTQRHHRLAWHVCWEALLVLWGAITSLQGPFDAVACGWLPPLLAVLQSNPRFTSAVGAFPGTYGADRHALLVWEVEEVDLCTRLTATVAIQSATNPLPGVLVSAVQSGFLFLQQPRLQSHCVASVPTDETSALEGCRIAAAQAHALRNALTALLKQPYHAVPLNNALPASFVFSLALLGAKLSASEPAVGAHATTAAASIVASTTAAARGTIVSNGEDSSTLAQALTFSLDLLRHFTVRELQQLRRITAGLAASTLDRSPDLSRVSTTTSVASRESSLTRSPNRGPLGDGDTVTDADEFIFTADGAAAAEETADQQATHLEIVQLVLNAYVSTVEEFLTSAPRAPGALYTPAVLQAVRHTTERLQYTLKGLARDLRDLRRPLLSKMVRIKTSQLQSLLERL